MKLPRSTIFLVTTIGLSVMLGLSAGCSYTFSAADKIEIVPVNSVKPEIDHSTEAPDCITAAQRIEEHLVVGMTLADVRRLVGKPRLVLPGSWWWTAGFSNNRSGGKPIVRYAFGPGADDVPISSFGFDSHGC